MSYPTTSRAAVLTAFGEPTEVREVPVPPLEDDGILVRIEAATMCGTDVHICDGDLAGPGMATLPLIMGHELMGRVEAMGKARTSDSLGRPLAEGDRIAWSYGWCDRCYWCTVAKQPTLCTGKEAYGWGPVDVPPYLIGGFSEFAYVRPRCRTVLVPEPLPAPLAASATCALRTAVHSFEAVGPLHASDTVVVQGVGPVGLYALACALNAGAGRVISIGGPTDRLAIASRWGAAEVIDITTTTGAERLEIIRSFTDGRGADLVAECAGVSAAFSEALGMVRAGGRIAVIGAAEMRPVEVYPTTFNIRQVSIVGTVAADISHYHRALEMLVHSGDRYPFADVLGETFGLHSVDSAIESIRAGHMKPVIDPTLTA